MWQVPASATLFGTCMLGVAEVWMQGMPSAAGSKTSCRVSRVLASWRLWEWASANLPSTAWRQGQCAFVSASK